MMVSLRVVSLRVVSLRVVSLGDGFSSRGQSRPGVNRRWSIIRCQVWTSRARGAKTTRIATGH